MAKKTTEWFVSKSIKVHGDAYCYDNTIYTGALDKLVIECKTHGPFKQYPFNHFNGAGCNKCARDKQKLGLSEFLDLAFLAHGDVYDYSESEYVTKKTKTTIICRKHGPFLQSPEVHLNGSGCPKCGYSTTLEEFLQKAVLVHGGRYGYEEAVYTGTNNRIKIRCKEHGYFYQTPNNHLAGCGCKLCSRLDTAKFKIKAEATHHGLYDYSESEYVNSYQKIKIICRIHGPFYQLVGNHLKGAGCPACKASKGELAVARYLDTANIKYVREKWFADLTNPDTGYHFRYDFYLPYFNMLIEYNGMQHYEPSSFKNSKNKDDWENNLKVIQHRDQIKNEYASTNNIKLLRIPYYDINKIPEILDEALNLNFGITEFQPNPK